MRLLRDRREGCKLPMSESYRIGILGRSRPMFISHVLSDFPAASGPHVVFLAHKYEFGLIPHPLSSQSCPRTDLSPGGWKETS